MVFNESPTDLFIIENWAVTISRRPTLNSIVKKVLKLIYIYYVIIRK